TLRLIPHPELSPEQQQLVAMERCMKDGVLEVTTRKATAIYMLQLLQVPTDKTDHAKANPVVLENLEAIADLRFGRK
ncbi:MAG: hypothetical protein OQK12_17755, partial [Motiliproteus sp.]|nr:hypothetical protein [Motiliproteus sp.]